MKKHITDEKTGISYTLKGEQYYPDLILPPSANQYEIGLWGQRHAEYLKNHKRSHYITLLTTGNLNAYLHDIDVRATEMYDRLVKQLADKQGITEQLKADDMMAWVGAMNNISSQAREIVNAEVIYR